jgi:hypothetical protein
VNIYDDFRRRLDSCRREYIILRQGSKDYVEVGQRFGFIFDEDGNCEGGTIRNTRDVHDWATWLEILLR